MEYRELLSGHVRLHVLHHAAEGEPLRQPDDRGVGAARLQDQSGHTLSDVACAGAQRYLTPRIVKRGGWQRQIYWAMPYGVQALGAAGKELQELVREVIPNRPRR